MKSRATRDRTFKVDYYDLPPKITAPPGYSVILRRRVEEGGAAELTWKLRGDTRAGGVDVPAAQCKGVQGRSGCHISRCRHARPFVLVQLHERRPGGRRCRPVRDAQGVHGDRDAQGRGSPQARGMAPSRRRRHHRRVAEQLEQSRRAGIVSQPDRQATVRCGRRARCRKARPTSAAAANSRLSAAQRSLVRRNAPPSAASRPSRRARPRRAQARASAPRGSAPRP